MRRENNIIEIYIFYQKIRIYFKKQMVENKDDKSEEMRTNQFIEMRVKIFSDS